MAVSAEDVARVTALLLNDIAGTIGPGHDAIVRERAEGQSVHARDLDDFVQRLVDEVQQYLHDTFAATSWPACPRHPNHPLWFRDGWWRCERDGAAIARLGDLRSRAAPPA